ncbi:MAG: hypothetical protein CVU97_03765 [Firmicutes bacterium HGW-Firmicutes-21]|nr:MAG: hypothetical protein CVU97_03765 [Firmicutes bacterium HGW-Firmicutes-21]
MKDKSFKHGMVIIMIIRQLRNNEKHKRDMLFSASFNMRADITQSEKEEMNLVDEVFIGAFLDDGETLMGQVAVITYKSMYYGNILTAAGIAGVSTLPEYRRFGCIRQIFGYIFDSGKKHGWDTSFLYPFSYRYYRKFGYERVLQHKTLKVPFTALTAIPRNDKAVLYKSKEQLPELLGLYNSFAKEYNVCFYRDNGKYFCDTPYKTGKYTYIWYNGDKPSSYATLTAEGNTLNISELVWLDRDAILGIIGFLRMYEGQYESLNFTTLDKNNPLDLLLDIDRSSSYGLYDGIMGRAIDIKKLLSLYPFPNEAGSLVIEVTGDFIVDNNGFYHIKYGGGAASLTRKKQAKSDITLSICSLSKLLFGDTVEDGIDFLPDTVIHSKKDIIKRIFTPHKIIQLERF